MLVFRLHVFKNVERIGRIKIAGNRTFQHVMDTSFEWPIWIHSFYSIGDEQRIEIDSGDVPHGLLDDTCPAGIRASHFQDFGAPLKHL